MSPFFKKSSLILLFLCNTVVLGKQTKIFSKDVKTDLIPNQVVPNPSEVSETDPDRIGRLLQFLALVNIAQGICKTEDGSSGVCMKASACTSMMGIDVGKCAQGYGTCCQISKKCSSDLSVVSTNGTRLVPGSDFNELCRYEIPRQSGVCQIKLDFRKFQIAEGTRTQLFGECDADTLTVSGHTNAVIGDLCGNLDGQHMYLDYGTNNKINLDIYMMTEMGQMWDIMVTMIKCDSLERAPTGCLQYFTDQRGTVKSFNFNNGHQLNNQDYSVCVRTNPAMKKITWRACNNVENAFGVHGDNEIAPNIGESGDVCKRDWVMIFGTNKYCGTAFPEMVETKSQPFLIGVHFNEAELLLPDPTTGECPDCDYLNTGFCLMYSQTPN